MKKIIGSICRLFVPTFVAIILVATVFGCAPAARKPVEPTSLDGAGAPVSPFVTFRDIPGVTAEEIAAIEVLQQTALRQRNGAFIYGMTMTTETFLKADGNVGGYAVLFCGWLTELFEIPFKPSIHTWENLWSGLESGDIDFTGDLMATEERREILLMTDSIVERSLSSFQLPGADSIPVIAMSRLPRLAFLINSAVLDRVEPLVDYDFVPVFYGDNSNAYNMLANGEVDSVLVMGISEASFDTFGAVKSETFFPLVYNSASLSTRNLKLAPVITVVQKALQYESTRDYLMDLYKVGYNEYRQHKLFSRLTGEEIAYIRNNPVVRIAAEYDNYPVSFYNANERQWQGAVFDVLHEIKGFTGLSFEVVNNPGVEFSELLKMLETGKVSMLSELLWSREREGRFLWPDTPTMVDFSTLISRSDYPGITFSEILNVRVGVARGTAHEELFRRWFPDHKKLFLYNNTTEVWDALEKGEIDMVMSRQNQFLSVSNYKERAGYKINVTFENYFNAAFGINKNEETLCSILNKTLGFVDTKRIAGDWTRKFLDYRYKLIEAQLPWLVGATALSLITLALILTLFYRSRNERKRLEKQQVQVEAASRAKSSFLATMSHEMRTPMNAIIGMTSIGKNSEDVERKDYALDKIEDAAVHLLSVINDVLDISKIEANKLELSPVEFNLERMLQKIVNIINFRMDEKHQKFTINVDTNIPRFVIGDDYRLSQVIMNLLSNAVKFSPEQGEISLDLSLAGEKDEICELRIMVSDNGIGITPEHQKKLFVAFEQADSGITREFGGTGLGLSISKHIVELMGGEIWVESEPDNGSRFIFTVKVERGQKKIISMLSPDIKWENMRILVVDDEEVICTYFRDIFAQLNLNCSTASNGFEACKIIDEQGSFDIYFIDWRMPGMDGIELTRKIKAHDKDRPSVVVMISSADWTVIKEMALDAGVSKYLLKPLFSSSIIDCVNECLGLPFSGKDESQGIGMGKKFAGKKLLLAEDVEINREILISLLEDTGIDIDCAQNGLEAVEMLAAAPSKYDVVLMDVQMPKMDGFEATRLIRAMTAHHLKNLPIIAMTAHVFMSDIKECLEAGMNDHIGKPIDIDDVMEKLNKYLFVPKSK